jgi:hypothetical protein
MFEGIKNGLNVFSQSIQVLFRYPVFAAPLLIVWLLMAPVVLYFYFSFSGEGMPTEWLLLILFGLIYFYSLLFSFSCVVLLELIQQHETGKQMSLGAAISETFSKDLVAIFIISFLWAIVWFVLTIIDAILSRKKRGSSPQASPQEAARVLSGQSGGAFSWLGLGIKMIKKLVRMFIFLVLPAVAWEDKGVIDAFKRGGTVLKSHAGEFLTAYAGSSIAAVIVFLPPALFFYAFGDSAPTFMYYVVIAYAAAAWVFSMYLEQMNMALLFMWHKKWEAASQKAQAAGKPIPAMSEIPMPSLLDDIPDLLN